MERVVAKVLNATEFSRIQLQAKLRSSLLSYLTTALAAHHKQKALLKVSPAKIEEKLE